MMRIVESFGFFSINKMKIKLKGFSVKLEKLDPRKYTQFGIGNNIKYKKKFECDMCGYKNIYLYRVKNHINGVHLKLRQFICEICDWSSCYQDVLRYHIKFKHGPGVKCKSCEKQFKSDVGLRYHLKLHENQNGFFCEFCNKRLESYKKLEIHIRMNHFKETESFECKKCNKKFLLKSTFYKHNLN